MNYLIKLLSITFLTMSFTAAASYRNFSFPTVSYVSFPGFDLNQNPDPITAPEITISGQLRIPNPGPQNSHANKQLSAVVILHSTGGIENVGSFYAKALNRNGIATLEIDMWSARSLAGGLDRTVFPTVNIPDAMAALQFLTQRPEIDPERIALMGFSWGGAVTMLSATESFSAPFGDEGPSFSAFVAHYPVCWAYNNVPVPGAEFKDLSGKPLMIQIGSLDDYDRDSDAPFSNAGETCNALVGGLPPGEGDNITLNVYEGAYHLWDRLLPAITFFDPFADLGDGGDVRIIPNIRLAFKARREVIKFFQENL